LAGVALSKDGNKLLATSRGVIVLDGEGVAVVPLFYVPGDVTEEGEPIEFPGHVLVEGHVLGPVSIRCEDLYVRGNVEAATIEASGDVCVGGGILGKEGGTLLVQGKVTARSIQDATIEAGGDTVVRDSIAYSNITSNGMVHVVANQGSIVGGTISDLEKIEARRIGSDFGAQTTMIVGKDFLTSRRLTRIDQGIRTHQETLSKIELIKQRLAQGGVQSASLLPGQQDVLIALLQREAKARDEHRSLVRARSLLGQALKDFLSASIRVIEELTPPVKVQICSAVEEIGQRMGRVVLMLDRDHKVFAMKGG
jgi:uncharacterized protein (DUF342 family)